MTRYMSVISSSVRVIGWMCPWGGRSGGKVGSARSSPSTSASETFANASSTRSVICCFSRLAALPASGLCSGGRSGIRPNSSASAPLRPSRRTRTCSTSSRLLGSDRDRRASASMSWWESFTGSGVRSGTSAAGPLRGPPGPSRPAGRRLTRQSVPGWPRPSGSAQRRPCSGRPLACCS